MSGIKLTDNQKAAVNTLDQNVSVSAGAGSGKTAVLVERFCRIIDTLFTSTVCEVFNQVFVCRTE